MSKAWSERHTESERLASAAEAAMRGGNAEEAKELYRQAGEAERAAFGCLEASKERTRGITAVSAVSLLYKAKDFTSAQGFALECLTFGKLPDFAVGQLRDLLQTVWSEETKRTRNSRRIWPINSVGRCAFSGSGRNHNKGGTG